MKQILILIGLVSTLILVSCGFLLSPLGQELIIDAAGEAVKIEKELVHPQVPTNENKSNDEPGAHHEV